ncbi:MAG: hypothetical protein LQ339_005134 [Xanthoria mediterranea]|nr:MAG: hypothetical protein LQ339_005134 [Xanthoria mediterranea]
MSWKETRPGRFERPLTCAEGYFKQLADTGIQINREHWAIRVHARFCWDGAADDPETALRHAWKTMRFDHPEIASFAEGDTRVYQVPEPDDLLSWLTETFVVIQDGTVDDLLGSIRPSRFPRLYFLPQYSDLLIQLPHWYIDGIGSICLLNNMFEALADPREIAFGTEPARLLPVLEQTANLPTHSTRMHDQVASKLLTMFTSGLPSISVPMEHPQAIPGATGRLAIILQNNVTQVISSVCRARKTTVTAAVHAALIAATQEMAGPEMKSCNYTSWGVFSLRPYLAPDFVNPKAHPVNLHVCGLPLTIRPSSFAANVSHLSGFYKQLANPESRANVWPHLDPFYQTLTAAVRQPPQEDTPPAVGPLLDSIGIADRYLKSQYGNKVTVSRFWLSTEVLSAELLIYLWTWQGEMKLSACYNKEFHAPDRVRRLLEITRDKLLEYLDIPQSA